MKPHLFDLKRVSDEWFAQQLGDIDDEPAGELNDNFAASVVIDFLEVRHEAMMLHELEELDDDLGGRAKHHLALALLLSVVDDLQDIAQDAGSNHLDQREDNFRG